MMLFGLVALDLVGSSQYTNLRADTECPAIIKNIAHAQFYHSLTALVKMRLKLQVMITGSAEKW